MRKLKLQADDVTVESFTTSVQPAARGTAHAHGDTLAPGDAAPQGAGDPTVDQPGYGVLHTASCTECETCNNGPTC